MKEQVVDRRLARRAARADERAFAAIFRRYNQEIYRFCLSILGNAEDARDALQNTMVKALQALPGEKREMALRPWLYRVAHNQSIDMLRRRREVASIDPELAAPGDGPAETAVRRNRLRQLLADLAELPERQRAALLMRELGGLEFDQIGETLGSSGAAARQTVYEARMSLRALEEGREMSCDEVMHRLSNDDRRRIRRRDVQAHLRACSDCRAFRKAIETRRQDLAALTPLPALASAGILHAILGGASGTASGAATTGGATVAVGAGKAVTAGVVAKSAATVAVVAAVGVSAANRTGLIDAPLPGGGSSDAPAVRSAVPAQGGAAAGEIGAAAAASAEPTGKEATDVQEDGAKDEQPGHPGKDEAGAKSEGAGHGNGADGTLPPAATHGQETAAAHKGGAGARANGNQGGHSAPRGSSSQGSGRGGNGKREGGSPHRHPSGGSPKAPREPPGGGSPKAPSRSSGQPAPKTNGSKAEARDASSEGSP